MRSGHLCIFLPVTWLCVSCYPDFVFGPGDSGGADDSATVGSSGGATNGGSTARASSVGVGQGGGGKGPILIGGEDAGGRINGSGGEQGVGGSGGTGATTPTGTPCVTAGNTCERGETCCFDTVSPYVDRCASTCTNSDLPFECHNDDDCVDKQCCVEVDFFDDVTALQCKTSCASGDYAACSATSQCGGGQACYALFPNEAAYDTYGYCD